MEEHDNPRNSVKLSVVIPVFNEEPNLKMLHTQLMNVMSNLDMSYEIIYVDDGSKDNSFQVLRELHRKDGMVKIIRFTRNFGQHIAITAGLDYCKGEIIVLMDADLQDKPEEIPKLLTKLSEGYDIVYGYRGRRQDSSFKRIASRVYLYLLAKLTNQTINPEIASFRVMTRKVVDYFNQFRERSRFYGGLVAWLGFPYAIVPIEHSERFAGKTKYSLLRMVKLGIEGVVSFSDIPLRLIGQFGFVVSTISFIIGIYYFLAWLIRGIPVPGYTSIIVSIFFMGGIQLIVLGVISRYIGSIHVEIKKRPLYVIKDVIE